MTTPARPAWRRAAGAVLPWLPVLVLLGTARAWWPRLPDQVATHWTGFGRPDGFGPATVLLTTTLVVAVVGALAASVAAYRARPGTAAAWLVPAGGMLAGGATGLWLTTATATLAGGTAAEAGLGWRFVWLLAGLSWGTVVHLVGYGDRRTDLDPAAAVTVAMDTPTLLGAARSPTLIATYSSSPLSMSALADVLAGKAPAPGRSPIAVAGLPRSACKS